MCQYGEWNHGRSRSTPLCKNRQLVRKIVPLAVNHVTMTCPESQVANLRLLLTPGTSVALIPHQGPDGDAMGSVLALYHFLKNKGLLPTVVVPNDYPSFLNWLPGNDSVVNAFTNKLEAEKAILQARLIFHVDHNDIQRTGMLAEMLRKSSAPRVLVDHHHDAVLIPDVSFYDPQASATAELVYQLIVALDGEEAIDLTIATCIYTGIMTDTGCFSYNSSRPDLFGVVEGLLRKGINKDKIYGLVYDNFSEHRMRLLGDCLRRMEVIPEYQTAIMTLSLEQQQAFSFVTGDAEGFVNYPLSVQGVVFSAFFTEKEDKIRISFRSRGAFRVNRFAAAWFNGGGHENASGGESSLSLQESVEKFRQLLPLCADELSGVRV